MTPPIPPGPDDASATAAAPAAEALDRWFVDEVLPLEPALMRMLRRHWRRADDIADLRQEVYTRVYESAGRDGLPSNTGAYVFRSARNLLIDQARRARVISFDLVAELEELPEAPRDEWSPERVSTARAELPPRGRKGLKTDGQEAGSGGLWWCRWRMPNAGKTAKPWVPAPARSGAGCIGGLRVAARGERGAR